MDSHGGGDMIQAPKLRELDHAAYELAEFKWRTIAPLLPNNPLGVARIVTGGF
jgi:hypothetical protein